MKFITLAVAIAAAIPAAFALTVNSPASVVECEPTQISWSGGVAPYYLSLVPGGQPAAAPLKQFPTQTGTEYTWSTDLASGTSISIALKDSTGTLAYSSQITIQAGSSTSCVNTAVQESGSSTSGAASTGSSGSTAAGTSPAPSTAAGTTAAGTTTVGTASTGSTAAGTTAAGTTVKSSSATTTVTTTVSVSGTSIATSGAGRLSVSSALGVAGMMGLVGAALF